MGYGNGHPHPPWLLHLDIRNLGMNRLNGRKLVPVNQPTTGKCRVPQTELIAVETSYHC